MFLRGHERVQRHDQIVAESVEREGLPPSAVNPVWVSVLGVDIEGNFFTSIVDDQIIRAIEDLPEDFRTVVLLSAEGLQYAEIAELMEVPVGTVKSRLFRGRRRLQKALYDYAVEMGYVSAPIGTDESG